MSSVARHEHQRGQALIESIIYMPLFLLILFALIWLIQATVLNERAQNSVRYSGLVSNEANPYSGYSLYTLYNNVGGRTTSVPTTCVVPIVDAFDNDPSNFAWPGPKSAPFWQPNGPTANGTCTPTTTKINGGSLTSDVVVNSTDAGVSVQKTTPSYINHITGGVSTLGANANWVTSIDLATIMRCFPTIQTTASASIVIPNAGSGTAGATVPLSGATDTTPIADTGC